MLGHRDGERSFRVQAIVLRRHQVGEKDRILSLFTREYGRLSAVARGAAGPKSRLCGLTEPLVRFTGQLAAGRNLDVLTQGRVEAHHGGLRRDLERLTLGTHLSEVVETAAGERQPLPALWDALAEALRLLETAPAPHLLCRAFEMKALGVLGYWLQLTHCVEHGGPIGAAGATFHPARGGVLCRECADKASGGFWVKGTTLEVLRSLQTGTLAASMLLTLLPAQNGEVRRCLVPALRHHLDIPLRALELLDALAPAEPPPGR